MTTSVPVSTSSPNWSTGLPAGKMACVAVRVLRARHAAPFASCNASAMTPDVDTAPRTMIVPKPNSAERPHRLVATKKTRRAPNSGTTTMMERTRSAADTVVNLPTRTRHPRVLRLRTCTPPACCASTGARWMIETPLFSSAPGLVPAAASYNLAKAVPAALSRTPRRPLALRSALAPPLRSPPHLVLILVSATVPPDRQPLPPRPGDLGPLASPRALTPPCQHVHSARVQVAARSRLLMPPADT